ncbi:type II toxin-antitoxin system RelB/DinJ family antitoxin [Fibrobacter sp. UWB10]|uniref:type II toxin-antitoxin system RelB/DinJ family antitoxin n=1 Tax=Fibrobacter sp. UWB10 TaxID=1896201 RepID=UPI0024B7873B|nr:type II toxin-antitoxin system RelB/DinJ family antitoxin [Fibrobacter sp. UWB10]
MSKVIKNLLIDPELLAQATPILEGLGLTVPQALTIFLRQIVLRRGLPFEVKVPKVP